MPINNPKPQTIATRKYQKKMGFVAKSYKIKQVLADDFKTACEKKGVSQAAQISKMMAEFITKANGEEKAGA